LAAVIYTNYANSIFGCGNVYSDAYSCIISCGRKCYEFSGSGKTGLILAILGGLLFTVFSFLGIYGVHSKSVSILRGIRVFQIVITIVTFIYFWICLAIANLSDLSGISGYMWPLTVIIGVTFFESMFTTHSIRIQLMIFTHGSIVQPLYNQLPPGQGQGQPPMYAQQGQGQPPMYAQPPGYQPPMGQPYGQAPVYGQPAYQ